MTKLLPVAAALAVVAVGTYYQGIWSERWGKYQTEKLKQYSARLSQVPIAIGDWEGTTQSIDEKQFKASNCDGCIARDYRNRRSGQTVSVYLVSGTGRHVTIHTPDWCYPAQGYEMDNPPIQYSIDVGSQLDAPEFQTTTFSKQDTATGKTERLRIFWSYCEDGQWRGPRAPKPTYGTRPALYKVYLITPAKPRRDSPEDSPTIEFAKEFFPAIREVLFPRNQAGGVVTSTAAAAGS